MRVLLVHPDLRVAGGAERVALHMLHYLTIVRQYQVVLLTLFTPDLELVSKESQIKIDLNRITIKKIDCPKSVLVSLPFKLQLFLLHYFARKISKKIDIPISSYNELDFGKPGIIYFHHPSFPDEKTEKKYHLVSEKILSKRSQLSNRIYHAFLDRFARTHNVNSITLVNSEFIKEIVTQMYGIDSHVVYPGFISEESVNKSSDILQRKKQILLLGRLSEDKGIVPFLESWVKSHISKQIPLVIAGFSTDAVYLNKIREIAKSSYCEIQVFANIASEDLIRLRKQSRYYVNPKLFEHFGIATLEAIHDGCLPIVHFSGGVREIVPITELQYQTYEDVGVRIDFLEANPEKAHEILESLQYHIRSFNTTSFYSKFDKFINLYVDQFVNNSGK